MTKKSELFKWLMITPNIGTKKINTNLGWKLEITHTLKNKMIVLTDKEFTDNSAKDIINLISQFFNI